jgi:hypothetical protein
VAAKAGSCLRGAQFVQDALAPTQLNVMQMWGALFDVDEGEVPEPDEIAERLGCRCVIWSTYNHMQPQRDDNGDELPPAPRYAVFVPFAEAVEPVLYRVVWELLAERLGEGAASGRQWNLDRLRYLPRLPNEAAREHYFWSIYGDEDERLDPYEEFDLPDIEDLDLDLTVYHAIGDEALEEPDQSEWISELEAVEKARTYFQNVGPDVQEGGRHFELFKVGCKLWWNFWLERDHVLEVLREVNNRFPRPKPDGEVLRELDETFARTRGHCRVEQPDAAGCMRVEQQDLSHGELRQLAMIEKKSTDPVRREVGEILLRLLPDKNGHVAPIAKSDYRDKAVRIASRHLGQKLPDHNPQKLAELFEDSLAMSESQQPGAPSVSTVHQLIMQAQTTERGKRELQIAAERSALEGRIKRAFGTERTTGYTEDEIQEYADVASCTTAEWRNRWVVVHGRSHYFFVGGDYKAPIGIENFTNAALVDLSPVPAVSLYNIDKQGKQTPMNRQEVISRYGTLVRHGVVNLAAQRSYYDAASDTFHEAPCPLRTDLEPEYNVLVDQWLRTFPLYEEVAQWLAWASILERSAAILYLQGPPKSGKTLLAYALSRLWSKTSGPTDLGAYFDSFNDDLTRCPLLFADEKLPPQLNSRHGADHMRHMVQSQSRSLKRKFLSNVTLNGHFRFIFAANNDRLLPGGQSIMTDDDADAITERVLHVHLDGEPAAFLQRLPKATRQSLIDNDIVAKHALWLRDNRRESEERFVVSGRKGRVTQRYSYAGVKGELLQFLYNAVTGEGTVPIDAILPLFVDLHTQTIHVGVNTGIVIKHWNQMLGDKAKPPSPSDLSDAIRSLLYIKGKGHRVRFGRESKQRRYQIISTTHMMDWAKLNDFDPELLQESLAETFKKDPDACVKFDSRPELRVVGEEA